MQNALQIAFSRKPMYNFRILLNRGKHDFLAPSHDPGFAEVVPSWSSLYLEVVEAMEDTAAEDLEDYEDELFDADEISNIVKFAVETTLSTCEYENTKVENCRYLNIIHMCCCQVGHWVNSIVETSLSALSKLPKSYKYIGA